MNATEELEHIREINDGILRPEAVVDFAADPETALHAHFTWDDTEAAHKYRLWQAREIIRVQVQVTDASVGPVRMYVSLMDDRKGSGGGYRTIDDVMASSVYRSQLLDQARRDMDRFSAKYGQLEQLAQVLKAMRKARKAIAA
jgi:hypothetical protein